MEKLLKRPTSFWLSRRADETLMALAERHERSKSWIVEKLALTEFRACRLGRGASEASADKDRLPRNATALSALGEVWDGHRNGLPPRRWARNQKLAALNRLSECPDLGIWREVIERMAASRHCNGQNSKGWRATFDFLLLPGTRAQVLEGEFDDPPIRVAAVGPKAPMPDGNGAEAFQVRPAYLGDGRTSAGHLPPGALETEPGRRTDSPDVSPEPPGAAISEPVGEVEPPHDRATAADVVAAPDVVADSLRIEVLPSPLPILEPPPIVRTYEDPDAPPWIGELVDRIAYGDATPEDGELYRRWCRGEEVEAPGVKP
jgi:hypothetical protein